MMPLQRFHPSPEKVCDSLSKENILLSGKKPRLRAGNDQLSCPFKWAAAQSRLMSLHQHPKKSLLLPCWTLSHTPNKHTAANSATKDPRPNFAAVTGLGWMCVKCGVCVSTTVLEWAVAIAGWSTIHFSSDPWPLGDPPPPKKKQNNEMTTQKRNHLEASH